MFDEYNRVYTSTPYEPLIPKSSNPDQFVFKFNSIYHFVGWVENLDKMFKRGSSLDASDSGDSSFTLSQNLEDAYNIINQTKFEQKNNTHIQTLLRKLKKSAKYQNEGYELEVPEFIAGSENYWIDNPAKNTQSKIISDPLFIECGYLAMYDAEECKKAGLHILNNIYSRRIIPRKLIASFSGSGRMYNRSGQMVYVFIDISFSDINGICKTLHPSTFRRLMFRLFEIYPDLTSGYGKSGEITHSKGMIGIQQCCGLSEENIGKEVEKFLGVVVKK